MSVLDKLKKFLQNKKLGIQYGIDSSSELNRGGEFLELKIISAEPTYEKDISEIPLEKSKVVNDNVRLKPKKVKLRVLITNNTDFFISANAFNSIFDSLGITKNQVTTKLDLFEKIHSEALMCDLTTMTREYRNMQLVNYSFAEEPQNAGKYLFVDMLFQEMMLYELVTKQDSKRLSLTNDNGAGFKNNTGILG